MLFSKLCKTFLYEYLRTQSQIPLNIENEMALVKFTSPTSNVDSDQVWSKLLLARLV